MSSEGPRLPLRMVKADQMAASRLARNTGEVETSSWLR